MSTDKKCKMIKLNVKHKTIQLLGENKGENIYDFWLGKNNR